MAVEELLIATRRYKLGPDEVADRLEMTTLLHRDLLTSQGRNWVTDLFASELEQTLGRDDLTEEEQLASAAEAVVAALEEAMVLMRRFQTRARFVASSVREAVPIREIIDGQLLVVGVPQMVEWLNLHTERVATAETQLLAKQEGTSLSEAAKLLGISQHKVKELTVDRRSGRDRRG